MAASRASFTVGSLLKLSDRFSQICFCLSKLSTVKETTSRLVFVGSRNISGSSYERCVSKVPGPGERSNSRLSLTPPAVGNLSNLIGVTINQSQLLHTSSKSQGLKEFFDDPKTYGEPDVKSGRPWSLDELRLKDNATLHKLWYVLLKEQNMLLTMEAEAERSEKLMPSPERIKKVKKSMRNLQQVVRERDEALTELRTGHHEEHPGRMVYTPFGYQRYIQPKEHLVPMYANKRYARKRFQYQPFVKKYLARWLEQEQYKMKRENRRRHNLITKLRKRFPDADVWQKD